MGTRNGGGVFAVCGLSLVDAHTGTRKVSHGGRSADVCTVIGARHRFAMGVCEPVSRTGCAAADGDDADRSAHPAGEGQIETQGTLLALIAQHCCEWTHGTLAVTELIIRVHPWYNPQYVLPIAGMVLGNSMTGISLALERLFGDLGRRSDEVRMLLALGASPWEASLPSIRAALTAGLIPTINAMNAVGIVSIPGMMTGQIIAGANPGKAARYQIVVMLMLSAATAIGSMMAVALAYHKSFDREARFVLPESKP